MGYQTILTQMEDDVSPINHRYYKCLEKRQIILNEDISADIIEKVIIPLMEFDNDGSGKPITLFVTSGGGDIFSGMALVDLINKIKTPLNIIGLGYCFSMAILILMAGKNNVNVTRTCFPSTVGLLHAGSVALGCQDTNQAKDFMEFNSKYEVNVLKKFILENSNISEKEFKKLARKEKYYDAQEMLDLGIIDAII